MEQMFFLAGVLIIVMSCHPYSREVEAALVLSGDNRSELEQVLNHFRQKDSRKFEAACFLIANMPYHKSKYVIFLEFERPYTARSPFAMGGKNRYRDLFDVYTIKDMEVKCGLDILKRI